MQHFQDFLENGFWLGLVSKCYHGRLEGRRKVFFSCLLPVVSPVSVAALCLL